MVEKLAPNSSFDIDPSHQMNRAMRISFCSGIFLLILKLYAYSITGSAAILSDCSESVIHVFAVGFATFSMWFSLQPADTNHQYGHDKIGFFSAGFEGAMIIIAALYVLYESIIKLIYGTVLSNLTQGISCIGIATIINGVLGLWLISQGKKYSSLILTANGRHLLTDCVTSLCVVIGLIVVQCTHIVWFDPLIGIAAAIHILTSGTQLVIESVNGLMDSSDPMIEMQIRELVEKFAQENGILCHKLRHRKAGILVFLEIHLVFQKNISLISAHEIATKMEGILQKNMKTPLDITTHLEPESDIELSSS